MSMPSASTTGTAKATESAQPLSPEELRKVHAYWRAANYISVGQIYLYANPLLREPLQMKHIKPRLLGHWGTTPGLNFIYVHLNRLVKAHNLDAIYIAGPGHGGPGVVANTYLEGTYSEVYPHISPDADGLQKLFKQFSFPGGIPSHVAPETPGSIHEGGELGYAVAHAYGAVFDNPDLIAACVVGDGEAESGPLAASWHSNKFLNPARDGAVLPILHLNGYKIANPAVLARLGDEEVGDLLRGHGYEPRFVAGDDVREVHRDFAAALQECYLAIRSVQQQARERGVAGLPRWPALVLRTPKGWTGPRTVDGVQVEGTFRAHQVPLPKVRENPEHLRQLEAWLRSYRPELRFDAQGRLAAELAGLAPAGDRRMGANPHANGGRLAVPLDLPSFRDYEVAVAKPASERRESTRALGVWLRDVFAGNAAQANFRIFCPDELDSNRLSAVFDVERRCWLEPTVATDEHLSPDGRVMEVLSEHLCQGWLEGYLLTGRHGLFVTYEAFAMVSASMTVQHAKWLEAARELRWRRPVPSLNVLLTSTCVRTDHCLLSSDYVNLIVIDKQPQLQYLDVAAARAHCARGASVWQWAGTDAGGEPDVVLACAGDVPTMETLAAAWLLRQFLPHLRVRVVNVVDLMVLFPADRHPHGMDEPSFLALFTADTDVVMAFHGYPGAVHQILHGRSRAERFHVRGYNEQGTTTT